MSLAKIIEVMVVDDTSVSRLLITDALDQMGIQDLDCQRWKAGSEHANG